MTVRASGRLVQAGLAALVAAAVALGGAPPAQAAPVATVDISTATDAFGYIPLTAFGGNTVLALGDEDLASLATPSFRFNGETFSSVLISSNGYLVPGGADETANSQCCEIAFGPARPNGLLAPFWTDLDGTGTTGALVNVLTDGVGSWLVVEWHVRDAGTAQDRRFQVWIGLQPEQDITYTYDWPTFVTSPAGQDFAVGVENADGSHSDSLGTDVLPTADQRVTSTLNQVPVAADDAWTTVEDTTLTVAAPGVLANDSDGDGQPITAALVSGPAHGTLVLSSPPAPSPTARRPTTPAPTPSPTGPVTDGTPRRRRPSACRSPPWTTLLSSRWWRARPAPPTAAPARSGCGSATSTPRWASWH